MSGILKDLVPVNTDFDRNYPIPKPLTSIQTARYSELKSERFISFMESYPGFKFDFVEAVILIDYLNLLSLNRSVILTYLNRNNNIITAFGEVKDVYEGGIYIFSRFITQGDNYQPISVNEFVRNTQLHGRVNGSDFDIRLKYDSSFLDQVSNLSVGQYISVEFSLPPDFNFFSSNGYSPQG